MKKIFYFVGISLLLFSCEEPLEDTFKELDEIERLETIARLEDERLNGTEQVDTVYELTDEDYEAVIPDDDSDSIGRFKNFSSLEQAEESLIPFLKEKFPTFKDNSSAEVTFKLFVPQTSLRNSTNYEVSDEDYESQGGNIARFGNFSDESDILKFLNEKFTDARFGDLINLTYKFFDGSVNTLENKYVFSRDSEWFSPLVLSSDDYTLLGQNFPNFSDEETAESLIAKLLKRNTFLEEVGDVQSVLYVFTFVNDDGRQFEDRLLNYTYDGENWMVPEIVQTTSLSFVLKKRTWKSGAITKYTFSSDDYSLVATSLADDAEISSEVGNLGQFGNFYRQTAGDNRYWDEDELLKAFTVILNNQFPDAEPETAFEITINVWIGSNATESFEVTKQEDGTFVYSSSLE